VQRRVASAVPNPAGASASLAKNNAARWKTGLTVAPPAQNEAGFFELTPTAGTGRIPVSHADPAHASVVQILSFRPGETVPRLAGTGVFVAEDLLVTAAHVIFDPSEEVFGSQRMGYAGMVVLQSEVLRILPAVRQTQRIVAAPGYTQDGDPSFDLAVIQLNDPVGAAQAVRPHAAAGDKLVGMHVNVYGYPQLSSRMFSGSGSCIAHDRGLIFHTADVTEGQSGGAVMAEAGNTWRFVGLHRAGPAETPRTLPQSSGAVRFTPAGLKWIADMGENL